MSCLTYLNMSFHLFVLIVKFSLFFLLPTLPEQWTFIKLFWHLKTPNYIWLWTIFKAKLQSDKQYCKQLYNEGWKTTTACHDRLVCLFCNKIFLQTNDFFWQNQISDIVSNSLEFGGQKNNNRQISDQTL